MSENIDEKRYMSELELIRNWDLRQKSFYEVWEYGDKIPYNFGIQTVLNFMYTPISEKVVDIFGKMVMDRHRLSIFTEENIFICRSSFFDEINAGNQPSGYLPRDLKSIDVLYVPIRVVVNGFTYWILAVIHVAFKTAKIYNSNADKLTDMAQDMTKLFKFIDSILVKSTRKDKSSQVIIPSWTMTTEVPNKVLVCDRDDSGVSMLLNLNFLTLHLPVFEIPPVILRLMRHFMVISLLRGFMELCDGNVLKENKEDNLAQNRAEILCDMGAGRSSKRPKCS
jgi:hypothetical protein